MNQSLNSVEIYKLLEDKEYHQESDLIFFENLYGYEDLMKVVQGYDFTDSDLKLYFMGSYFCVELEELLNHTYLDDEEIQTIRNKLINWG